MPCQGGGGIQTQVWNFPHFFFPLRTLPLGQNFILEAFKQFLLQLSIRCFLKLCSEVFAALERTARQEQTATRDVPAAASSLINSPHLLTPEESTRKNINQHSYLLIPFLYISRIILYTLPQISYWQNVPSDCMIGITSSQIRTSHHLSTCHITDREVPTERWRGPSSHYPNLQKTVRR